MVLRDVATRTPTANIGTNVLNASRKAMVVQLALRAKIKRRLSCCLFLEKKLKEANEGS